MGWKIYCWVFFLLNLLGIILMLPSLALFTLADVRGIMEAVILIGGTYQYSYSKKILNQVTWNALFWYLLIAFTADLVYVLFLKGKLGIMNTFFEYGLSDVSSLDIALSILFSLPSIYAIYQLTQHKQK